MIRHAAHDILAYGVPDSQKAPPDPDELPPEPRPDAEIIDLEKGKWTLLNAGRLLAGLMLTPGSLSVGYQPGAAIKLEVKKTSWESPVGFSGTPEPFTLKDFRVVRPSPETVVLSYTQKADTKS